MGDTNVTYNIYTFSQTSWNVQVIPIPTECIQTPSTLVISAPSSSGTPSTSFQGTTFHEGASTAPSVSTLSNLGYVAILCMNQTILVGEASVTWNASGYTVIISNEPAGLTNTQTINGHCSDFQFFQGLQCGQVTSVSLQGAGSPLANIPRLTSIQTRQVQTTFNYLWYSSSTQAIAVIPMPVECLSSTQVPSTSVGNISSIQSTGSSPGVGNPSAFDLGIGNPSNLGIGNPSNLGIGNPSDTVAIVAATAPGSPTVYITKLCSNQTVSLPGSVTVSSTANGYSGTIGGNSVQFTHLSKVGSCSDFSTYLALQCGQITIASIQPPTSGNTPITSGNTQEAPNTILSLFTTRQSNISGGSTIEYFHYAFSTGAVNIYNIPSGCFGQSMVLAVTVTRHNPAIAYVSRLCPEYTIYNPSIDVLISWTSSNYSVIAGGRVIPSSPPQTMTECSSFAAYSSLPCGQTTVVPINKIPGISLGTLVTRYIPKQVSEDNSWLLVLLLVIIIIIVVTVIIRTYM